MAGEIQTSPNPLQALLVFPGDASPWPCRILCVCVFVCIALCLDFKSPFSASLASLRNALWRVLVSLVAALFYLLGSVTLHVPFVVHLSAPGSRKY